MNRAFERIEIMRNAVHDDFQRLVVLVAADLASLYSGVKSGFGLFREIRVQNACARFFLMSFDHALKSRQEAGEAIGPRPENKGEGPESV